MNLAIFTITDNGRSIAERIRSGLSDRVDIYSKAADMSGSWLKETVGDVFENYDGIVFVSAIGIAVRAIAPHIENKTVDPAVVVIDDVGTFSVSILSGHIGGGNDLAQQLASIVGAMPVITTATDMAGKPAIDVFMKELGLKTNNMERLKRVSAGILREESACIFADINLGRWGDRVKAAYHIRPLAELKRYAASYDQVVVVLNDEQAVTYQIPNKALVLKTRNIYAGIGCRKGASCENMKKAIKQALAGANLHTHNLRGIASIDIKKEENAIKNTAQYFGVNITWYSADELEAVLRDGSAQSRSKFVEEKVGAGGVCEPAAILASKGGKLIVPKTVFGGTTVALAEAE